MSEFKVPVSIPQDLLLIQELVGLPERPRTPVVEAKEEDSSSDSEDISSSGSEDNSEDSEDEVAANLVVDGADDSDPQSPKSASEPSSSDSESDSDSEEESKNKKTAPLVDADVDDDDDEDAAPEADITVPDIDKVAPDEHLEKVGEIMSIIGQVVIVRGLASHNIARGSQRALDSDTLLVFDDRTVMGYIYETFGPTNQPLYQVKFNSKYPLDPERVKVSKEVFVVPSKSKFIFVDQIKAFKGSDASNVYDEEPADDELEFSDDEAEAAYKSRMKRKRGESRSRSVTRDPTPNPSHMRDQELVDDAFLSRGAYDEHGPYDLDFRAPGPSRPAPIPYDDPYATTADQHVRMVDKGGEDVAASVSIPAEEVVVNDFSENFSEGYDPRAPPQTHMMGQGYYQQDFNGMGTTGSAAGPDWGYPPNQMPGMVHPPFGGQNAFFQGQQTPAMPFVQPHINPRFAPFGFNMGQNPAFGGQYSMPNSQGAGSPDAQATGYPQQPWNQQWGPQGDGQQG
ncbi:hypothetical protein EST38_g3166 [Candolleomyces aberdarensis]|uniref:H/ACA ribonucleoprotein complex non-core subunit NAF1 n=1 Tax=Candolleomyces aberdarensis TaxID=2316362 RepID=A0A4Q2DQL5_9AGAR|nr:hypothetical protein EST38_g3166 [Candolleomyces aberdarensis]